MKRFLLVLAAMVALGCSPSAIQIQAATANGVAHAANAALPMLIDRFQKDGIQVIDHVKASGGTEADARTALAVVEHDWAPIWAAWTALRVAQEAWADALEGGADTAGALKAVRAAYCQLVFIWPKEIQALPIAPVRCTP